MNRTYPELKTEVARLAAEAERARAYELPTVIAELNLLIERYQLTEAMIFGASYSFVDNYILITSVIYKLFLYQCRVAS